MAKKRRAASAAAIRLQQLAIRMAHARGVKKGRSLGFDEGWSAATAYKDAQDERAVLALASIPPKPRETLAPEAVDLGFSEAVDAVIVEGTIEDRKEDDARWKQLSDIAQAKRRLMEPLRFN